MRANAILFWILAAFFALAAALYTVWSCRSTSRIPASEWAGTVALTLTTRAGRLHRVLPRPRAQAQGAELPEDRLDANIDDGDAELGYFSPWSWWPIVLAGGAALGFLGLAIGFWISFLAIPIVVIALVGWVYEYYRGNFAR